MATAKVIFGNNTLIDLTEDTVVADKLLSGFKAHGADGQIVNGSMNNRGAVSGSIATKTGQYTIPAGYHNGNGTVGIDATEQTKIIATNIKSGVTILGVQGSYSSDATASASEILLSKTAYVNGNKITGNMPNNGAVNGSISTKTGEYTISAGYHNGNGKVSIDSIEQAKIIASNIKYGITILGVTGKLDASALIPYRYDYNCGYIDKGVWKYENPTQTYIDIYEVISSHNYFFTYGVNVGSRYRVMFTTVDVTTKTSNVTGTQILDWGRTAPSGLEQFTYTAPNNGYILIGKDNIGKTGIKTYLYDTTAIWL